MKALRCRRQPPPRLPGRQLLAVMNPAGPDLRRLSYDSLGTVSGTWVVDGTGPAYLTRERDPLILWFRPRHVETLKLLPEARG